MEHVYIWRPAICNYQNDLIRLKALQFPNSLFRNCCSSCFDFFFSRLYCIRSIEIWIFLLISVYQFVLLHHKQCHLQRYIILRAYQYLCGFFFLIFKTNKIINDCINFHININKRCIIYVIAIFNTDIFQAIRNMLVLSYRVWNIIKVHAYFILNFKFYFKSNWFLFHTYLFFSN